MALRYGALPYGALTVRGSTWSPFSTFNGSGSFTPFSGGGFVPAADVERDGDDVVLTLELPGVDVEKDVEVEVRQGRLVIAGRRSHDSESESGGTLVREIRSGSFRREFALPKGVTAESVEADYQNGLLRVRVHAPARAEVPAGKVAIRRIGIDAAERSEHSEQEGEAEQN